QYTQQWSLHAHQHSPILLKVTSTNPLESYHNMIKSHTQFGFGQIGAVRIVVDVGSHYEALAYTAKVAFYLNMLK
ncbi:hypothetical protein HK096_002078, partial [Nowakowskiella sp. JEL0078]